MHKKNVITYLIIFNLLAILVILLGKISVLRNFINVIFAVVIIPIIFGVFLFYILKPLNNIFLKKKMKGGSAASLTLLIFFFIAAGIMKYFGDYFIEQFINLKMIFFRIVEEKENLYGVGEFFKGDIFELNYYEKFLGDIQKYAVLLASGLRGLFDKGMQLFSDILLVILIVFYLLKDEEKIKKNIVNIFPGKYKYKLYDIVEESDEVLSSYILGQAKVALSLALMVFVGYKIIGMASPLLLSSVTFVLAFIPFVGFFISMIIPYIIAIALGWNMIIKLSILVIIAQTLKGRIIVPLIMGKTMNIHPITDIFLVVGAASLVGPIGAFVVVPIYSLGKVIFKYFNKEVEEKLKEFKE
ncbi:MULTISPECIES: AI-2E family transporter [Clostridium]|jgi:predicted PurR-regulated permease PerM|nr:MULTISPECIES: AI-2E family transporter [Clostridium]MDB1970932.1 AI-2E family transporter [Clostridium tertium]MDU1567580.1 AI-2E family transporter [Clostridium sp.]MDU2155484.1 AI-2E family transporter [Clostridium sp.]MDU2458918.1 AI-2E family transporter [Clostridium sp.]MDU3525801.1 AI-2E family transporter [Clostridium sp.]